MMHNAIRLLTVFALIAVLTAILAGSAIAAPATPSDHLLSSDTGVVLSAPSAQTQDPPTDATGVSQAVNALIAIAITFFAGGGLSYFLQMWDRWRNWESSLKPTIVIILSGLIAAGLTSLRVLATPELFAQIPTWGLAFIGFAVVFFASQFTYQRLFAPPSNPNAWSK